MTIPTTFIGWVRLLIEKYGTRPRGDLHQRFSDLMLHRKQFIDQFHYQNVSDVVKRIREDVPDLFRKEIAVIRLLVLQYFQILIQHLVPFVSIGKDRYQKIVAIGLYPGIEVQYPLVLQLQSDRIAFGLRDPDASYHVIENTVFH